MGRALIAWIHEIELIALCNSAKQIVYLLINMRWMLQFSIGSEKIKRLHLSVCSKWFYLLFCILMACYIQFMPPIQLIECLIECLTTPSYFFVLNECSATPSYFFVFNECFTTPSYFFVLNKMFGAADNSCET